MTKNRQFSTYVGSVGFGFTLFGVVSGALQDDVFEKNLLGQAVCFKCEKPVIFGNFGRKLSQCFNFYRRKILVGKIF